MRCSPLRIALPATLAALVVVALLSLAPPSRGDEEALRERAERLAALSPEQKEDVLSKKERFDALTPEQQAKLRELHTAIAATPNADRLHATLSRYNDWLKTLSSAERTALLTLPSDERIAEIKKIIRRQESIRFREFAGNLPDEDKDAIFRWLEAFSRKHEQELIESISSWQFRQRLLEGPPEHRPRMLVWSVIHRGDEGKDHLYPSQEDFAELLPQLSEKTRSAFESRPADQKVAATHELMRAAVFSKFMPQVKDEDLRQFFSKLEPVDRERLEAYDPDQMKRELTRMYHSAQFRNRERGKGPPSFGPRGEGKRYGPPPSGGRPGFGPRGNNGIPRGEGPPRGERREPSK